ncbi:MAG TPA: leucine-rich repeat domain-containing protein [Candidatus Babeliaceae bacterium]|nr:leucine-rich repeat domain-containing protein [Candidatus Babeliaceae bacterium]
MQYARDLGISKNVLDIHGFLNPIQLERVVSDYILPMCHSFHILLHAIGQRIVEARNFAENFLSSKISVQEYAIRIRHWMKNNIALLSTIEELDLSGLDLKFIPEEIKLLKNLVALKLSGNPLLSLPEAIRDLKKLRYLIIEGIGLKKLPEFLRNMPLACLNIMHNPIANIPAYLRMRISSGELVIWRDETTVLEDFSHYDDYLHPHVYHGLCTLFHKIAEQIPEASSFMRTLSKKSGKEKIKEIRDWMRSHPDLLAKVVKLDLRDCGLKALPPEIGLLTHLQELDLSNNRLGTLPESLGNLVNLCRLNLSHNGLRELPSSFGSLTNLTVLDLSKNSGINLPENGWEKLKNLQILLLQNNMLTQLPTMLGRLPALRFINLSGNGFDDIPEVLLPLDLKLVNSIPADFDNLRIILIERAKLKVVNFADIDFDI